MARDTTPFEKSDLTMMEEIVDILGDWAFVPLKDAKPMKTRIKKNRAHTPADKKTMEQSKKKLLDDMDEVIRNINAK